jgi:Fur family iron response transcriptional regulator
MNQHKYTRDSLPDVLRAHAITPTHQRIEIAHALFSCDMHLSADQILAIVNERAPEASKATVYNTLNLFIKKKLLREVTVDSAKAYYDVNTTPHHHFYNVESGELLDIDASDISISGLPPLPVGTVTEGIDVIIRIRSKADQ